MKTPNRVPAAVGVVNLCEVASHLLKTMPVNAATKHAVRVVLRSAVNKSCPDYRGNDNKKNVRFISHSAAVARSSKDVPVVADHAVPLSLLLDEVYKKRIVETTALVELVSLYSVMALVTREEDSLLRKRGLAKRMPEDWDGKDALARYRAAGISLMSATDHPGEG
jgi:hypothetical protein